MPKRFNYTGRKKILRKDVRISIRQSNGSLSFDADLDLADYDLDPAADVFIEAYRSVSTLWKRFSFGRVATFHPPADRSLDEFQYPDGIQFRVKVASNGESIGKLLAHADRIKPRLPDQPDDQPKQSLIDPIPGEIGDELWRVKFDDRPQLVMSDRLEDWKGLTRDPLFRALVLPAVMRQILWQVLIVNKSAIDEEDPTDWQSQWLLFAQKLPGMSDCPAPPEAGEEQESMAAGWIDDAVEAFAAQKGLLATVVNWQNQGA